MTITLNIFTGILVLVAAIQLFMAGDIWNDGHSQELKVRVVSTISILLVGVFIYTGMSVYSAFLFISKKFHLRDKWLLKFTNTFKDLNEEELKGLKRMYDNHKDKKDLNSRQIVKVMKKINKKYNYNVI